MTQREKADRKALVQLALAVLGGAVLLGSAFGGALGALHGAIGCWCCDGCE